MGEIIKVSNMLKHIHRDLCIYGMEYNKGSIYNIRNIFLHNFRGYQFKL